MPEFLKRLVRVADSEFNRHDGKQAKHVESDAAERRKGMEPGHGGVSLDKSTRVKVILAQV